MKGKGVTGKPKCAKGSFREIATSALLQLAYLATVAEDLVQAIAFLCPLYEQSVPTTLESSELAMGHIPICLSRVKRRTKPTLTPKKTSF